MEPGLVAWKVKVGQKQAGIISRRAMKVGSRVDEIIKTGSKPDSKDSSEVRSCFEGFNKWLNIGFFVYKRGYPFPRLRAIKTC